MVFGTPWCLPADAASAYACCAPDVGAGLSNFTGRRGCRLLRAESVTTLVTLACKGMTRGSTVFSKWPTTKSYALSPQDTNMTWKLLALRAGYIRLGLIGKY